MCICLLTLVSTSLLEKEKQLIIAAEEFSACIFVLIRAPPFPHLVHRHLFLASDSKTYISGFSPFGRLFCLSHALSSHCSIVHLNTRRSIRNIAASLVVVI